MFLLQAVHGIEYHVILPGQGQRCEQVQAAKPLDHLKQLLVFLFDQHDSNTSFDSYHCYVITLFYYNVRYRICQGGWSRFHKTFTQKLTG